ncbi:integral membrane protein [Alloalcanivorax gelatiniphagus]
MTEGGSQATRPAPRRAPASTLSVLGAALISGLSGYAALILAARTLSVADNADFLVFWGVAFAIYGVLIGVTTETTRAVTTSGSPATASTRVMPVAIGFGLALVLAVALAGPVWAPLMFGERWPALLGATVLATALFAMHAAAGGVASGRGAWAGYSLLVAGESAARLVLFAVVAITTADVLGYALASAVASGFWLVATACSRRYRDLWTQRVRGEPGALVRRLAASCTAAGVSALLLVGYPVLLRLTTPDDVFAGAAPIVLAVSLCRAPLLVPLGAYQNVVVSRVAAHGVRALVPVLLGLAGLTMLGVAGAWVLGPWALHLVNPDYHVDGAVFAGLVLGAGLVALLTVTGAAALALDHHAVYLAGWIAATVVAVVVLLAPWSLEARVVSSLLIGPAAGVAVHLVWGRHRIG